MKIEMMRKPEYPEVDVFAFVQNYWGSRLSCDRATKDARLKREQLAEKRNGRITHDGFFITTDEIDGEYVSVGEYEYAYGTERPGARIVPVKPLDGIELFVELAGGRKSEASFYIKTGVFESARRTASGERQVFYCADSEYLGDDDEEEAELDSQGHYVYCYGLETLAMIDERATAMCAAHPESLGRWRIVDRDGNAVLIWAYYSINSPAMKSRRK